MMWKPRPTWHSGSVVSIVWHTGDEEESCHHPQTSISRIILLFFPLSLTYRYKYVAAFICVFHHWPAWRQTGHLGPVVRTYTPMLTTRLGWLSARENWPITVYVIQNDDLPFRSAAIVENQSTLVNGTWLCGGGLSGLSDEPSSSLQADYGVIICVITGS